MQRDAAAEERERQLTALSRVRPRGAPPPRAPLLHASLTRDVPIEPIETVEELRALLRRDYRYPVISLYLTLEMAKAVRKPRSPLLTLFHSLRTGMEEERAEFLEELSRDQRWRLDVDLTEIETVLLERDFGGARSLVILKSGEDLNRLIGLPLPIADLMVVDPEPFVAPLERVLETHRKLLVIEVEKENARFWTYHLGMRRSLDRVEDFVPSDTVDRSRPGKVQRHRLTHLEWHLRRTARVADHLMSSEGCQGLVLVGDERIRSMLADTLSRPLADRLSLMLPAGDPETIEEGIERHFAAEQARHEEEAVAELEERLAKDHAVAGLEEVLDATNLFLARRLLLAQGAGRPGYMCRRHRHLSLEPGPCPYCGREMTPVADLANQLLAVAHLHGIDHLLMTERPELLEPHGGVAAELFVPTAALEEATGHEAVATGGGRG
ncbi:MAG: peptide chain release factor subunit 1 [Miltoncostaeaceae bacterium]|nr:peptide chain release factor subunit 1 [Miltoncostaeaceae bacterium]